LFWKLVCVSPVTVEELEEPPPQAVKNTSVEDINIFFNIISHLL